jgi:hypothetical protein
MTKEQALKKLEECQKNSDTECAHSWADEVLCQFLRAQGHDDLVEVWEKVNKWYA